MPWKECTVMEVRLRFVARLLEGEPMSFSRVRYRPVPEYINQDISEEHDNL